MKREPHQIHYHLNKFEFAQAKKALAIKKGVAFICQREDLLPFLRYGDQITVRPIQKLSKFLPVVYWQNGLKYGFLIDFDLECFTCSNIKGHPYTENLSSKYLLGRIQLPYPYFFFKALLKIFLKTGKYRPVD
jgi:hypothetical protein